MPEKEDGGTITIDPPKDETPTKPQDAKPVQTRRRGGGGRKKNLKPDLEALFSGVGTMLCFANLYDGTVVLNNAERLAEVLNDAAKHNPKLYNALRMATETSSWTGVITATAMVAIPIAANHGLVPPATAQLVGAEMPPERTPKPTKQRDTKTKRKSGLLNVFESTNDEPETVENQDEAETVNPWDMPQETAVTSLDLENDNASPLD